jgi:GNAT superfamily N-acetyltransferase
VFLHMISKLQSLDLLGYSNHLKAMSEDDKRTRFGHNISNFAIDQLMLGMAYNPSEHHLWVHQNEDLTTGWGHLATCKGGVELAVSVDSNQQGKGIASELVAEMIAWAKVKRIENIYMHCYAENQKIQHIAAKHNLQVKERTLDEITGTIRLDSPTWFDVNSQKFKEFNRLIEDYADLRVRMASLWFNG